MAREPASVIRARREAFAFALAHGTTVLDATAQLARQQWEASAARLAEKRCGTRIEDRHDERDEDGGRALQWWQR